MYLKLNRIQYPIYNLGPGKRMGIWTQGCSIKCEGCISSTLWHENKGKYVNIDSLLEVIISKFNIYDGITITGGEPFDQYEQLILFCKNIKEYTNLNIYIFTGFTLNELIERHSDKAILKFIDYLLDGPYRKELHHNGNFKGSSNQSLYEIKDGKPSLVNTKEVNKKWSLSLVNNKLYLSGIPKENEISKLEMKLKYSGINIKFR